MAQKASILCSNVNAVADQAAVQYFGGYGVLVTEATTYPAVCQLQTQSLSGKWIPVGSNIASDGFQALDLPAGQYRIHMAGGAVSAFYAALVSVARV
jgi:hypothetical protein